MKNEAKKRIKPFLKWAGGKYRLLDKISPYFPTKSLRFYDVFAGGASISLNVNYPQIIINDINYDLIEVYKTLKRDKDNFISLCKEMFVQENNNRERYNDLRKEFNETKDKLRKSILFIYLNRHCFNGLCRYNGKGEFNVPIGGYQKPYFPGNELRAVAYKLNSVDNRIVSKDFRDIFKEAKRGDCFYADPPYAPSAESDNFNDYFVGGFGLKDQLDLGLCANKAAKKGATVVVSNSYVWFTREFYVGICGAEVKTIDVSRTISADAKGRKSVKEIIAVFKPE